MFDKTGLETGTPIQLIYYSVAAPSLTKKDIFTILEVSRENNPEKGITGCMLYYNDAFIQILEGNRDVIECLYAKIEQDERHYNIRQVYSDTLEKRLFENWSMAFYDLDKDLAADNDRSTFRKNFVAIAEQAGQNTMAGQLFCDIADQILEE